MTALRILGQVMLLVGIASGAFGLWCAAGGLRVVISNRVDERRRGGKSAKFAVTFIVAGLVLSFAGLWLAGWVGS